ncbi:class I SAM-dependent methyltransferase [bacterium]|nr:class I SAM-dependent methyltransferase [bacterium]
MKQAEVSDQRKNNFQIDYKYCNNAYMVADERCVEVPWMLEHIKDMRDIKGKQIKVIDVGCSESRYLSYLKTIGCDVYGNDIRDMQDKTVFKGFFKAKIQDIKTDIGFDAVLCISVLEHIGLGGYGAKRENFKKAQILALKKMSRLLNDQGLIFLTVPYGKGFVYYSRRRNPFILRHRREQPRPFVECDNKLLKHMIDKAGLAIFKEEYYCWLGKAWQKVKPDFLKNVKYGNFNACNAAGIALLTLRKSYKYHD